MIITAVVWLRRPDDCDRSPAKEPQQQPESRCVFPAVVMLSAAHPATHADAMIVDRTAPGCSTPPDFSDDCIRQNWEQANPINQMVPHTKGIDSRRSRKQPGGFSNHALDGIQSLFASEGVNSMVCSPL